jgi:DNA-binding MarR family transcriptional regulator
MNEELEIVKLDLNNIDQVKSVKKNPVVKATILSVLKAVPIIGELIDSTIDVFLTNFQNEKRNKLLEIILSDITITSEMVNDVEFIMNFAKTLEASNRLATSDKVKYFANLLKNSYFSSDKIDNNEFEECFDIINSLSYRQIQVLTILHNIENNPEPYVDKATSEKEYLPVRYWSAFKKELEDKLHIKQDDVYSIMKAIEKTGLFTIYNGFSFDSVEEGTLTPYFKNFAKRVLEASSESKTTCD